MKIIPDYGKLPPREAMVSKISLVVACLAFMGAMFIQIYLGIKHPPKPAPAATVQNATTNSVATN